MAQDMRGIEGNGNRKMCAFIVDTRILCAHTGLREKEHSMPMTAVVSKPGHNLDGKRVYLGGRSTIFPPRRATLVVQDVRDAANQWHRVEASWLADQQECPQLIVTPAKGVAA